MEKPIIAWTYMVEMEEMEDGLTKKQIETLLKHIPNDEDIRLIPFDNEVNDSNQNPILEANSIALGFIDNKFFECLFDVQKTLASVCNDWNNETTDGIYKLPSGEKIKMLCDAETV